MSTTAVLDRDRNDRVSYDRPRLRREVDETKASFKTTELLAYVASGGGHPDRSGDR